MRRPHRRAQRRWCKGKNFHKRYRRRGRPRDITYTSRNPKYRDWKKRVHCRDAYCCQLCGTHKRKGLHAHHIRKKSTHPEISFEVWNGISLCKRCHKNIVTKKEEVFEDFFDTAIAAGHPLPYSIFVWFNSVVMCVQPRTCECGCGESTRHISGQRHARYVKGHHRRRIVLDPPVDSPIFEVCPKLSNSMTVGFSPAPSADLIPPSIRPAGN